MFYAVNDSSKPGYVEHIGAFSFNFNPADAITDSGSSGFFQLNAAFDSLIGLYQPTSFRFLSDPSYECWTVFPKIVYDKPDEREDHINILMQGVPREDIEAVWHSLSNTDVRLLCLRRNSLSSMYHSLAKKAVFSELLSDFELASHWNSHIKAGGSFLLVGCHQNILSITSYMLGKLRAATYIRFDDKADLSYLWLQSASHHPWMRGIHEYIYLFGRDTFEISIEMKGIWEDSSEVVKFNNLENVGVEAPEQTYGFDIASAFPAILLAIS